MGARNGPNMPTYYNKKRRHETMGTFPRSIFHNPINPSPIRFTYRTSTAFTINNIIQTPNPRQHQKRSHDERESLLPPIMSPGGRSVAFPESNGSDPCDGRYPGGILTQWRRDVAVQFFPDCDCLLLLPDGQLGNRHVVLARVASGCDPNY